MQSIVRLIINLFSTLLMKKPVSKMREFNQAYYQKIKKNK